MPPKMLEADMVKLAVLLVLFATIVMLTFMSDQQPAEAEASM
jgi:hypothetical protein